MTIKTVLEKLYDWANKTHPTNKKYYRKIDVNVALKSLSEIILAEKKPHEGSKCNCDWNKCCDHLSNLILGEKGKT